MEEASAFSSPDVEAALEDSEAALIEYVKEKDSLRLELKEKDKEIQHYKAKVYDLSNKIDELQTQVKDLQQEIQNSKTKQQSSQPQQSPNKLQVRPVTRSGRSPIMPRAKSAKQRPKANPQQTPVPPQPAAPTSTSSVVDVEKYNKALQTIEHLDEVAKKFPELKLSVIFSSEKFFKECDVNNDGLIDEQELEKLLIKQGHLYSNKDLKEIMSNIDVDNNQAIDMMEYLAIMERVQQRKRVNLPQEITRSATCAIQ